MIISVFGKNRNLDKEEFYCRKSEDFMVNMFLRKKEYFKEFFVDLPTLDISCSTRLLKFIWKISLDHYNYNLGTSPTDQGLDFLVECGLIESLLNLLKFYVFPTESEEIEKHYDFLQLKNQNVKNVYYSLYILSVLTEDYFTEIFFTEESTGPYEDLQYVVIKYLNNEAGFTFFETRATARLVAYVGHLEIEFKSSKKIGEFLTHPDIIKGMYFLLKNGYDLVYTKFIQHRFERLDYQVEMIYGIVHDKFLEGIKSESHLDDREEIMQQRMYFIGFGLIRWVASYFLNLFYYFKFSYTQTEQSIDYFIEYMDELGFFNDFLDIIKIHNSIKFKIIEDNYIEEYLLKILAFFSFYENGRTKITTNKNNVRLVNFIGDLSLSTINNDYANLIMVNLLRDPECFDYILSELGYHISVLIHLQDQPFVFPVIPIGNYTYCEQIDKTVGEEICEIVLNSNSNNIEEDDEIIVKCELFTKLRSKDTNQQDSELIIERIRVEEGEITSYMDILFPENMLIFVGEKISELGNKYRNSENNKQKIREFTLSEERHFLLFYLDLSIMISLSLSKIHGIEIITPVVDEMMLRFRMRFQDRLSFMISNNLIINDAFSLAKYLSYTSTFLIEMYKYPFGEFFKTLVDNIDYYRFKFRDVVLYKTYGLPTHLRSYFIEKFRVSDFEKPTPFIGRTKFYLHHAEIQTGDDQKYAYKNYYHKDLQKNNKEEKRFMGEMSDVKHWYDFEATYEEHTDKELLQEMFDDILFDEDMYDNYDEL